MSDLSQFLRDRLDEDARIARAATPDLSNLTGWIEVEHPETKADEEHAMRHVPPRILAEVESKLAIVDAYLPPGENPHPGLPCVNFEGQDPADRDDHDACSRHLEASKRLLHHDYVLRLLARPYRNHPDFDASWLDD
jgi:hypothetical protein